jgi:predicted hydrolase (HD superfamily)
MTREEALSLVREYVKNENLVKHMLCVEAAMRFYAEKYGQDVDLWGLTGLLHDFDWEIHPTAEQHPSKARPSCASAAWTRSSCAPSSAMATTPEFHEKA